MGSKMDGRTYTGKRKKGKNRHKGKMKLLNCQSDAMQNMGRSESRRDRKEKLLAAVEGKKSQGLSMGAKVLFR